MLTGLKIRNLAVIEELDVCFGRGFTVVTGETGAGKSIMVGALGLLLGERAAADAVRAGTREASVEAAFELDGSGIEIPEAFGGGAELVARRVISADGRSRIFVNGHTATLSTVAGLLAGMVDISSQHAHQILLREDAHTQILDAFAGSGALVEEYRRTREEAVALLSELTDLRLKASDRSNREDFLAFQLKEIDSISPKAGEDLELGAEKRMLQNAEKLSDASSSAEEMLYSGDGAAYELLRKAVSRLTEAAAIDARLGETAAMIEQAVIAVDEASSSLRAYVSHLEFSPSRLEEIENRLADLNRIVRKHGGQAGSIDEVLRRREELADELESLKGSDGRIGELETVAGESVARCIAAGSRLSGLRTGSAHVLSEQVSAALKKVAMPKGKFEVGVESSVPLEDDIACGKTQFPPDGFEKVTFSFSANPGEPPRPLHKIASGGELSRTMLAVKWVLSEKDPVRLYVFDEVDTGIGGGAAEVVGRHLRGISEHHQVVCITHLPQIAALADTHLVVTKSERSGRTFVSVEELDGEKRVGEIARMLGGVMVTDATIAHARDMLSMGASKRKGL